MQQNISRLESVASNTMTEAKISVDYENACKSVCNPCSSLIEVAFVVVHAWKSRLKIGCQSGRYMVNVVAHRSSIRRPAEARQ